MIDQQKILSIYSNEQLSLSFTQQFQTTTIAFIDQVKGLYQLKESLYDTISIVVTDSLDCFEACDRFCVNAETLNCLILIVPHSLTVPSISQFSKAVVYRRSNDETTQVALEKIFSSLIKFTTMSDAYIDSSDIKTCLQFRSNRYLKIFRSSLENLEHLPSGNNFISQLAQNDSIMITVNTQISCTKESFRIINPVLKHLGENFDGEIFWGCSSNENAKHDTDFYILQACAA